MKTPAIRDRIRDLRRVPARDLVPHPENWRIHPKAQIRALRSALEEIGCTSAVLAREMPDGRLQILDGHLRSKLADGADVPVLVLDLDETEARKLLATHDSIGALALADAEKLGTLIASAGIESDSLRDMLADIAIREGIRDLVTAAPEDDAIDGPSGETPAVSRLGDIWICGDHRILCGDATDAEAVARLAGSDRASIVVTSPPYPDRFEYGGQEIPEFARLMTGVVAAAPQAENCQWLANLGFVVRDDDVQEYWRGWIDAMRADGYKLAGWYVWDKLHALPGNWHERGTLARSHEWVFHLRREARAAAKIEASATAGKTCSLHGLRSRDGTYRRPSPGHPRRNPTKVPDSVLRFTPEESRERWGHPCPYPVALPLVCVQIWTHPGEVVYDPFGGSGTAMIAAEKTGRRCLSVEINPPYVDAAVRRWQKRAGRPAKRESDGATMPQEPPCPSGAE